MNILVDKCYEARNGHYCHVLEVNDVYELQSAIESIYDQEMSWLMDNFPSFEEEFSEAIEAHGDEAEGIFAEEYAERKDKYAREILIDFFETIELHCLNDEHEQEVFDFNIRDFVEGL